MPQATALDETFQLVTGKLGIFYRELRDADQTRRLRRAEID
jgi:hypothetical protein